MNQEKQIIKLLKAIHERLGWAVLWLFIIMLAVCEIA